jgi:hypothetical protein
MILTRSPQAANSPSIREVHWDGRTLGAWTSEVEGADAVVNLTGKNVNCRYTQKNLAEIDASREDSVRVMAAAITHCVKPHESSCRHRPPRSMATRVNVGAMRAHRSARAFRCRPRQSGTGPYTGHRQPSD